MADVSPAPSAKAFVPKLLINGELVGASDGATFPLFNPATREKIADVPEATTQDVETAVAAAKAAFPAWSALDPTARGACLKRLGALIRKHNDELAYLESISMGRPVSEYFEGWVAAGEFDHYAEAWSSIQGQATLNTPGFVGLTLRQPYGVAGVIIPWNVPVLFLAKKAAPALIAGNTVVLKSSEKAPLASAKIAELAVEAGFPPGVFNIITGHGQTSGAAMSSHMDIGVLTFTGSGRTGRLIQEAAAKSNLKKVILELGGKSPAIVFDDANLEKTVAQTVKGIQWNSGQVCMANSRIYVQEAIASTFVEVFNKEFASVKAGNPLDKDVHHGPLVDDVQYRSVLSYIEEGKKSGTVAIGGQGTLESTGGYFVEPTVFLDTPEDARIMKEEIFGPVVHINTFKTEAEAIAKANDTVYGLYASVYTRDIERAMRVAKALDSGHVSINASSPTTGRDLPFGGYKVSGQGREGYLHSLDNFLETKTVLIRVDAE
ncbi:probable aldehyde dehydrogenase [Cephalotrichum gorgonifer]|uniref:aldehyde dehydrogenase (NAD(+)) n=1 Tax=Cephalotrichum gorgonifer TaxID=2041049 RepID=A0AAE8N4H0_9PEZI|nr:probable aldehyde dehydrogenase [Cephalotrichum gorgonifer]